MTAFLSRPQCVNANSDEFTSINIGASRHTAVQNSVDGFKSWKQREIVTDLLYAYHLLLKHT